MKKKQNEKIDKIQSTKKQSAKIPSQNINNNNSWAGFHLSAKQIFTMESFRCKDQSKRIKYTQTHANEMPKTGLHRKCHCQLYAKCINCAHNEIEYVATFVYHSFFFTSIPLYLTSR